MDTLYLLCKFYSMIRVITRNMKLINVLKAPKNVKKNNIMKWIESILFEYVRECEKKVCQNRCSGYRYMIRNKITWQFYQLIRAKQKSMQNDNANCEGTEQPV